MGVRNWFGCAQAQAACTRRNMRMRKMTRSWQRRAVARAPLQACRRPPAFRARSQLLQVTSPKDLSPVHHAQAESALNSVCSMRIAWQSGDTHLL